MENSPTWICVVALAARDGEGRLLLQKRPIGKHHGGLWEFPGGKVEPFEKPAEALVREIAEELQIIVEETGLIPAGFAQEAGRNDQRQIVLLLYTATTWAGEIRGLDGQEWGWFTLSDAAGLDLAPMDRQLLAGLSR